MALIKRNYIHVHLLSWKGVLNILRRKKEVIECLCKRSSMGFITDALIIHKVVYIDENT